VAVETVLITGGLGCLGGGLARYLVDKGYRVIIGSSRTKAQLPDDLKQCSLVYTNFDNLETLNKACSEVSCIIHLATVNAQQSALDPELAKRVNSIGTANLIQAGIKNKISYFLYFSTAHVYGSPLIGQIDESTKSRPSNPYALTHKFAEDFIVNAISDGAINGNIIRLSNSIGLPLVTKANCWTLFVNDVCKQAITDRRIRIHSNPNNERDFIPMNSVYEIAEYFLSNRITASQPVFNVGSGTSYTLLQVAEIIASRCKVLFGYSPQIVCTEKSLAKSLKLKYKVDKLTAEMKYITNNDLKPAIDEILKFCQAELH